MKLNLSIGEIRSAARRFFEQTIWSQPSLEVSGGQRLVRRVARFGFILLSGFRDHRVLARAPALTLSYLLALVPLLALSLFGASLLGFRESALGWLQQYLSEYVAAGRQEVVEIVIRYVEQVNVPALGIAGLVFLLWATFGMLATLEATFNDIWGVSEGRPIHKKIALYLCTMLVFPVLIFLSFALTTTVRSLSLVERARDVTLLSGVVNLMLDLLPVLGIVLGFTLIYKYMPYTRVRFGAAAIAGGVVGLTWYLTQWVFIWFQIGVTGNNAIYGAFAALPIFLVWLNTSWIIVLVGCEIAFAAQHESFYRRPVPVGVVSITQRERAAIQVLLRTWKRFVDDSPPERAGDIAAKVDLPRPVTAEIIEALVRCGMLERSARPEEALRPGSDLGQGRLGDLLLAYRHTGKINSGSLGGFLGKEVGAYHESLEAALRRAGSLDLAALTSRPSLISPSFPP